MRIICAAYSGRFLKMLDKPHYLNREEYELLHKKGMEALILSWRIAVRKIDKEGYKKYGFKLPKSDLLPESK